MSYSHGRSGGGARSISMRELMDMPFDQLASGVEAAAAATTMVGGGGGSSNRIVAAAAALPRTLGPAAVGSGSSGQRSLLPSLHRARSSSSAVQLPWSEDGGALMELAHMLLRDAAFHQPLDGGGGGSRGGGGSHPSGRRTSSPRVAPEPSGSSLHRLPLEWALMMGDLGRGGGGGAGGAFVVRPQSAAAGSEGGRSGLPPNYEQLLALDEGRMRRAVRPEVIRGLPVRTATRADASQQCNVCLERFAPSRTSITTLPCAHAFCSDCIRPWLATNTTCPVCRWAFPEAQTALVAANASAAS